MITVRRQIEVESIIFIAFASLFSIYFVWQINQSRRQEFNIISPLIVNSAEVIPSVAPVPKIDTVSQISSDGTKKLLMKTTHNVNGTLTFIFSTTDGSDANEQTLYTTTLSGSENMSIPFNSWSPDNKYFFIQKNGKEAMIFTASGEPFANGETYLDIVNIFKDKNTANNFNEATGWASQTLVIFNTTTPTDTKGPSYWFEVPGKAILQLSG